MAFTDKGEQHMGFIQDLSLIKTYKRRIIQINELPWLTIIWKYLCFKGHSGLHLKYFKENLFLDCIFLTFFLFFFWGGVIFAKHPCQGRNMRLSRVPHNQTWQRLKENARSMILIMQSSEARIFLHGVKLWN